MESLTLIPDLLVQASSALEGVPREQIIELKTLEIGGMPNGMESGRPSVAFTFKLPDGRAVWAETSLALLLTAVDGLKAKYGDPR